jgi:hypothetical protein
MYVGKGSFWRLVISSALLQMAGSALRMRRFAAFFCAQTLTGRVGQQPGPIGNPGRMNLKQTLLS